MQRKHTGSLMAAAQQLAGKTQRKEAAIETGFMMIMAPNYLLRNSHKS